MCAANVWTASGVEALNGRVAAALRLVTDQWGAAPVPVVDVFGATRGQCWAAAPAPAADDDGMTTAAAPGGLLQHYPQLAAQLLLQAVNAAWPQLEREAEGGGPQQSQQQRQEAFLDFAQWRRRRRS